MFAACFGRGAARSTREAPPLLSNDRYPGDAGAGKPGCVFCDVRAEKGFSVVGETDELVAFRDRNPAAEHHLLVVPRRHIANVKSLSPADVPLLLRMEAFGADLLAANGIDGAHQRLGYHIPPFNSVQHLHLHCLSLPLRSSWRELKYRPTSVRDVPGKRWGWFVDARDAREIVEAGRQVRVGSVEMQRQHRLV